MTDSKLTEKKLKALTRMVKYNISLQWLIVSALFYLLDPSTKPVSIQSLRGGALKDVIVSIVA